MDRRDKPGDDGLDRKFNLDALALVVSVQPIFLLKCSQTKKARMNRAFFYAIALAKQLSGA